MKTRFVDIRSIFPGYRVAEATTKIKKRLEVPEMLNYDWTNSIGVTGGVLISDFDIWCGARLASLALPPRPLDSQS